MYIRPEMISMKPHSYWSFICAKYFGIGNYISRMRILLMKGDKEIDEISEMLQ